LPTTRWVERQKSVTSPLENRVRQQAKLPVPKTENIIFIGSEMSYDSFWLKMMFVAAAYKMASAQMRTADRVVIAYVDVGYTHLEKLAIDRLQSLHSAEVKKIGSVNDVVTLMNREREDYKLLDVFFSSHGLLQRIDLNYSAYPTVALIPSTFTQVRGDAFSVQGRIYSYACRTGISVQDYPLWRFSNDADAKPEDSLAQKLADHFRVEVHAFLRRSFYGDVLRDKAQSAAITKTLKEGRASAQFQQVIAIPPEHEGLPHPGLADNRGPKREGTDNYALWRLAGGRSLPTTAETPSGLSAGMRIFTASN
jgi:hypothetical protein